MLPEQKYREYAEICNGLVTCPIDDSYCPFWQISCFNITYEHWREFFQAYNYFKQQEITNKE